MGADRKVYKLRRTLTQAECGDLQQSVDRLTVRLQTARNTIAVLREKLATERSARAVLAARLLDRQAEEKVAMHTANMNEVRLQSGRLSVEMQREHSALRELVTTLYLGIPGHEDEAAAARQSEGDAPRNIRWYKYLVGKLAGRTLQSATGEVIVRESEQITPEIVAAAEAAGLLFEIFLPMRLPPSDQDL
jgi:hypothetical protein